MPKSMTETFKNRAEEYLRFHLSIPEDRGFLESERQAFDDLIGLLHEAHDDGVYDGQKMEADRDPRDFGTW